MPFLARFTDAGELFYRFTAGTVGGIETANSADKGDPFEIGWKPESLADAPRYVWLEIACGVGTGEYGVTISSVRYRGSVDVPASPDWPHYPQQWDFERTGKARILVAILSTVASGESLTIKAARLHGRNLVLLAPIVQTCMVQIPIECGETYPCATVRGDSTDKRGFFVCEADPYEPSKPALFNPDGLLFY